VAHVACVSYRSMSFFFTAVAPPPPLGGWLMILVILWRLQCICKNLRFCHCMFSKGRTYTKDTYRATQGATCNTTRPIWELLRQPKTKSRKRNATGAACLQHLMQQGRQSLCRMPAATLQARGPVTAKRLMWNWCKLRKTIALHCISGVRVFDINGLTFSHSW
jgi:hypothetical protein